MQQLIIPVKGAAWKHRLLLKIARHKDFKSRLRIFGYLKSLLSIDLLKATTNSGLELLLDITDWVQYQIYFFGNYEEKSVNLFKKLSAGAEIIVDIGAHIGQYALEIAHADLLKNKKIFALEANPKTFTFLFNNIQINNMTQIVPILGTISNPSGLEEMYIPSFSNPGTTRIGGPETNDGLNTFFAAAYNVETLVHKFSLERIDLLKIDIEGYEHNFFKELFEHKVFPDNILFEYIPEAFRSSTSSLELLIKEQYSIRKIDGSPFTPRETVPEQNLLATRDPDLPVVIFN